MMYPQSTLEVKPTRSIRGLLPNFFASATSDVQLYFDGRCDHVELFTHLSYEVRVERLSHFVR